MNTQQIAKVLTHYRIEDKFVEPYSLVIDGNFLRFVVDKQLNIQHRLENILHGRIKLQTTSCILRQLELLGPQFRVVYQNAKKLQQIKCNHQMGSDDCIKSLVQNNQGQYLVATQDIFLRRYLRKLPNVPLLYFGPDQRVTIEDVNKDVIKKQEKQGLKKYLPKKHEEQVLNLHRKEEKLKEKDFIQKQIFKNAELMGVKAKTKIAKGPNPLSVRRKKKKLSKGNRQEIKDSEQGKNNQLDQKKGEHKEMDEGEKKEEEEVNSASLMFRFSKEGNPPKSKKKIRKG